MNFTSNYYSLQSAQHSLPPTPKAALSKVCGRSLAVIVGSNSAGTLMSFSCECCVLSGRGLCNGPITSPEESHRV